MQESEVMGNRDRRAVHRPQGPPTRVSSRRHVFLLVLLGLVSLTVSCGLSGGPPNVLLISLDSLRADRLGSYGYARDTSPFMDELAADGTIFSKMSVNTHGTPPSHASLFTSLYQETHRVSLGGNARDTDRYVLPKHLTTLAELLQSAGYVGVGATGGSWISRKMQFDQGFAAFNDKNYRGVATRANALVKPGFPFWPWHGHRIHPRCAEYHIFSR